MPTWASLAINQLVDETALNDAVSTSVFLVNSGQTVPTGTLCVSSTQASTWLQLDTSALPTGTQLPTKQQIIPAAITELDTILNFASPSFCFEYNNLLYYTDPTLNGVIYFDPRTLTDGSLASLIAIPSSSGSSSFASRPTGAYFQTSSNKMFVNSFYGGGMSILDLTTNTVVGNIAYATDGMYSRGNIFPVDSLGEIWGLGTSALLRINASTLAPISSSFTASGAVFVCGMNSKIYVFTDNTVNNVQVYDTSLNPLSTITGLCANVSNNGHNVSRGYYADTTTGKIYVGELSSTGAITVIDTTTDTISNRVTVPLEGKTYGGPSVINYHPIRNTIYVGGSIFTNTDASDSEARMWAFDVTTETITQTVSPSANVGITAVTYYPIENSVYVGSAGEIPESSPNTDQSTDGIVFKFN
jgi:hypothetical protein